jgi:altronate dehydratase large subunit
MTIDEGGTRKTMSLIRTHPSDNVAVTPRGLKAGQVVDLPWGGRLEVAEDIPASHKVALRDFTAGETVVRYGQPIGTTRQEVPRGGWLHSHNIRETELRSAKAAAAGLPPQTEGMSGPDTFMGYSRAKGPAGTRNVVLILPTVACAVPVARAVGRAVPEAVVIEHPNGCGRGAPDFDRTFRVLNGCGLHPNAGAVLLLGLGCEIQAGTFFLPSLQDSGKPFEFIEIQKAGGTRKATARGVEIVQRLHAHLQTQKRIPQPIKDLILGLQCGGSDALSGVTANPAVGRVSDWLIHNGGTVILPETTEMLGTQHLLQARAVDQAVAEEIGRILGKNQALARAMLGENAHLAVAPGNMDGGLSTIMEKSLGCIAKGGGGIISEVRAYAEPPQKRGLVIMDTPWYDVESLGGLVGAGCQVIFFTTGRGTPVGAPLAPVIKVASNTALAESMADDIDINAGLVADGKASLSDMGQALLEELIAVAEGKRTRAEVNDQAMMGISMTMEAL